MHKNTVTIRLLSLLILFCMLAGCSGQNSSVESPASSPESSETPTSETIQPDRILGSLTELSCIPEDGEVLAFDVEGCNLYLLRTVTGSESSDDIRQLLEMYDIEQNTLIKSVEVVHDWTDFYSIYNGMLRVIDDKLYIGEDETVYEYDLELNSSGVQTDLSVYSYDSPFFNDYFYSDYYSQPLREYYDNEKTAIVLKDHTDQLTLIDGLIGSFYDQQESTILRIQSEYDTQSQAVNSLHFCIDDLSASKTVYELNLDTETMTKNKLVDAIDGKYSDSYAVVRFSTDIDAEEDFGYSFWVWDYKNDTVNIPFDSSTYTYEELENDNDSYAQDLTDTYGINIDIHATKSPDSFNEWDVEFENRQPLDVRMLLCRIEDVFEKFPEGMFKETYNFNDVNFTGIDLYIVNRITAENTNAFASNINGRIYMVFPSSTWVGSDVQHELMHCFEYRIWDALGSDSYDKGWSALNPEGFIYNVSNEEEPDTSYANIWENPDNCYFMSEYAMTNDLEDHAVTFQYMFTASEEGLKNQWMNSDHLVAKAKYLCEAIRNSFDCITDDTDVFWEHWMDLLNE